MLQTIGRARGFAGQLWSCLVQTTLVQTRLRLALHVDTRVTRQSTLPFTYVRWFMYMLDSQPIDIREVVHVHARQSTDELTYISRQMN